tara:strand:- start:63 stop:476 length:414 start_codon:yes stop_codon:yes gene_type:complete
MTLRDLIKEFRYKPVFNILYKEYYKEESLSKIQSIDFLCLNIWNNLISKPFEPNKDARIIILIKKEQEINISFYSNIIKNEIISFGFSEISNFDSLGKLMDSGIEVAYESSCNNNFKLENDKMLAHIFREIISLYYP